MPPTTYQNVAQVMVAVYDALVERNVFSSGVYPRERFLFCLNTTLNEIIRDINAITGIRMYIAEDTANLTADQSAYSYPSNILDRMIIDVYTVDSSGNYTRLKSRTEKEIVLLDQNWKNPTSSTPMWWSHDPVDFKYRVYPPVATTVSSGLVTRYVKVHPYVYRVWGTPITSTLTASVTNANASVTLSSTPTGDQMATGDQVGIILDKPSSVTGIKVRSAPRFYDAALSGATVTLTETYNGPTDTTAYFVSGQKIDILDQFPTLGQTVVWGTAAKMAELAGDETDRVQMLSSFYMREVRRFIGTHSPSTPGRRMTRVVRRA
jgi:hypothetical protein